jgi:threonine dehydratase
MMTDRAPTAEGVIAAAKRIAPYVVKTPLLESADLNARVGGRVLMKAETLQHGGSFKFRGAINRLLQLSDQERRAGVVAWSSGNHAQGVARAAKLLGVRATIVMPRDAPTIKIDQVRAFGGEVVFFDRYTEDREAIGLAIARESGAALAPSFDHPDIVEGQGTLSLEAHAQAEAAGASLDAFVFCCGGGGMGSGGAIILEKLSPRTAIVLAEPQGFDDAARSLAAGRIERSDITRKTLCDALATPALSALTFGILGRRAASAFAVSDADVERAMRFAFRDLKLVLEPGGAAALAGVLAGKIDARGRTLAITLSGGNVDPALFSQALARSD